MCTTPRKYPDKFSLFEQFVHLIIDDAGEKASVILIKKNTSSLKAADQAATFIFIFGPYDFTC